MKRFTVTTLLIFIANVSFSQANDAEKDKIMNIIQISYVQGLQNEGNIEKIDSGFHPDFELLGLDKNDILWKLTIKEWKEKVIKKKNEGQYPRPENEEVSIKFLSVDITGKAAVAKFEFYVGDKLVYIDYLCLYKFSDGWKIVSKIYHKL